MTDEQFQGFKTEMENSQEEHVVAVRADKNKRPNINLAGYVYVAIANGFVKIGMSKNPKARMKVLSASNPSKVTLLAAWFCQDANAIELKLHSTYDQFRVNGEWFKLPSNVLKELLQSRLL